MPRSNERRTKGEAVEEEFPFLQKIISPEALERVLADTRWSGFLVRRMRVDCLFRPTGEEGDMETWIAYIPPPPAAPNHAERLPFGKELWEVFPYDKPFGKGGWSIPSREFVAIVQVHMHTDGEHRGTPAQIIVWKLPKKIEWDRFERCIQNIRRVAGWPRWKVYKQEPHPSNVKF